MLRQGVAMDMTLVLAFELVHVPQRLITAVRRFQ
jgi:hypothetical protein